MKILRFVFPFLFVRNWHDGSFEISRPRLILFLGCVAVIMVCLGVAYLLQAPVMYLTST